MKARQSVLIIVLLAAGALIAFKAANAVTRIAAGSRVASVTTSNSFSKSQTICLDPGHGGDDVGATYGDLTESELNLTVAQQVRVILESQGYQVFMTRDTNAPTLTNNDRYTFCNGKKATILVSVHHNFYEDSTVDYDTALYYKPADQALATSILDATATKLSLTNNGITQFEDGVLSKSTMPAALSEAFFITSDYESGLLGQVNSSRLSDEAQSIATGITNYFAASKTSS